MGTVYTDDGKRAGCYIISETSNETGGMLSRDTGTLATGAVLRAGTVLAKVGSEYVPLAAVPEAEPTGSETPVAILFDHADSSAGPVKVVVSTRQMEANGHELTWPDGYDLAAIDAAEATLEAKGIVVRY